MTIPKTIRALFASDINRRIEEVIKVDQTDDAILRDEIEEYVVTDAISKHYVEIFEAYGETPNKPHEGIAIWVSGFFGSGKSSFAKMLGLSIENRLVADEPAGTRFAQRADNKKLTSLLRIINEKIPTHAVIFDVSTDRGIRSGNQTLTEIMYGLFLHSLGYAKDLDLSELEIGLEEKNQLVRFEAEYRRLFQKEWADEKNKVAFALSEASRVLHSLEPDTYPMADSWVKAVRSRTDISAGKFAERANELMKRRRQGKSLIFVVDEVGQFVARDVQKMLDLQAIVQNLGVRGRGKHWIVVTSQEKLGELVSGLDDRKIELARLMDRFPLQVHLEPSDIAEVTGRRVLKKNADAEAALGKLFDAHHGRLTDATRMTADIRLPELSRAGFVDLYPLLPYQIDLIIQMVSGLRTRGGASKHVGGANRTIIKLAQQLLVNPAVLLAEKPVGALVRADQIYDLVEGNIDSEIRAKIVAIPRELDHPMAQSVAKAICLLQYVKSVHRTAENIAAILHPHVDADSTLASVREALTLLVFTHKVRLSEDGYRIPSPVEDDWDRQRNATSPKPGEAHRIYSEALESFWQPQPSHNFLEARSFSAGLSFLGRDIVVGSIPFNIYLANGASEFSALKSELRTRSQTDTKAVFWAVDLDSAIDHEMVEYFRSREMLTRRERDVRTADETSLIGEERARLQRHQNELRRRLRNACLAGTIYFRGNDRSPSENATDVGKCAIEVLRATLPDVFGRFQEAAARPSEIKKGFDALLTADNLSGLPPVFGALNLLRTEKGKTQFRVDSGPLNEILKKIEERSNYGETASGRSLTDDFAKEPFGWDFDTVRLFVLSLLRANKIDVTSKGQTIDFTARVETRDTFANNNHFRAATFRPKKGLEFGMLVAAGRSFVDTFGKEIPELTAPIVVNALRREMEGLEDTFGSALRKLRERHLPGQDVLESASEQVRAIRRGAEETTISTFNASHRSIKDAMSRASELDQALTEVRLAEIDRAQRILQTAVPFLLQEPDLDSSFVSRAEELKELLRRETFFRDLSAIDAHARALEVEYQRRFGDAAQAKVDAYRQAHSQLVKTPGWSDLPEDLRDSISVTLRSAMQSPALSTPISQIRAEKDACEGRLRAAIHAAQQASDGERLIRVDIAAYFAGGIETEEQLDAALTGFRDECARLIGEGKKVVVS